MAASSSHALISEAECLARGIGATEAEQLAAALQRWYTARSTIRSLWAFVEPTTASEERLIRVVIAIDPTPDGDDASPTWIGRAARWARELRETACCEVCLQRVDSALSEHDLRSSGVLITAQCWRDPSYAGP